MGSRHRKLAMAAVVAALASFTVACGGEGEGPIPTAPTPPAANQPPPPSPNPAPPPVLAPPPQGVSPGMWRVGFSAGDARLRRAEGAVHLVLPTWLDQGTSALLAGYVETLNTWGLKTRYSVFEGNVSIPISVVADLKCDGRSTAGCMTAFYDQEGRLSGGKIEFSSVDMLRSRALFYHEALRCLGIDMDSPLPGLMAERPSGDKPTPEELAMLLGRYIPPLLAQYAPQ